MIQKHQGHAKQLETLPNYIPAPWINSVILLTKYKPANNAQSKPTIPIATPRLRLLSSMHVLIVCRNNYFKDSFLSSLFICHLDIKYAAKHPITAAITILRKSA